MASSVWLLVISSLLVAVVCVGVTLGQGSDTTQNNNNDLSRILLKHLRFRELPDTETPESDVVVAAAGEDDDAAGFGREVRSDTDDQFEKRHRQRMLVSNLAALLSGLKDRQSEASMRMPSLRFGK